MGGGGGRPGSLGGGKEQVWERLSAPTHSSSSPCWSPEPAIPGTPGWLRLHSPPCSQVPQKHLCFEAASPSRGRCALSSRETWFSVPHEPDCPLWRQVRWTSGVFVPTWSTFPLIHPAPKAFTWQPDFPWEEHDGHSCAGTLCWTSRGNTSPFPADACAGLSTTSWVTLGKSFMARGLAFLSIK